MKVFQRMNRNGIIDICQLNEFGFTKLNWKYDAIWCNESIDILNKKKKIGEHKALIPSTFFDTAVLGDNILETLFTVFGEDFCFHHANGYAHAFGDPYKRLHHDHDKALSGESDQRSMVHFLIYPAGLDDDGGSLAVVPGSHHAKVQRNLADASDEDKSGLHYLNCAPGEVFLIYSSVWHGRGEMRDPSRIRYHMNFSYCRRMGLRKELQEWQERHDYLKTVLPTNLHRYLQ